MNNNIIIIKRQEVLGRQFTVYGDINEPLFLAKDIADLIGHSDVSKMVKAVDEDEKVKNNVLTPGGQQETWFLTEDGLYEVLMQSRKPIAKQFKKEVKAILKQLRQTGVVITESATPEAIDYQAKYGTRRIRKTFREANRIELDNLFKEFVALSKIERDAGRISNKDRIKCCDIIISELEDTVANDIVNMKAYEVLMIKDVIQTVLDQKQTWSNKMYGGKISNMNREIKNLKQQVEDLTPPTRIYSTVYYHGYSNNYQYAIGSDGKLHRTHAYNNWIKNFPVDQVPTKEDYEIYENIDFTKPIEAELRFICKSCFDVHNLAKSFLDMVFNRLLEVDDSIVVNTKCFRVGTCDSYEDGQIIFSIYNI